VYESGQFTPETMEIVARTVLTWRARLTTKLREVVAAHPPRLEVDLESLADLATVIFEGAFVVSRTLKDARTFSQQLRHLRTYIELLFA
jgi:TetR/AcrR family transcriptional repressor of nem operon